MRTTTTPENGFRRSTTRGTDRCRASAELAAEAVADYVARERETVAAIRRGLDDMAAGRLAPHDEVMAEMRTIIKAAEEARRRAS